MFAESLIHIKNRGNRMQKKMVLLCLGVMSLGLSGCAVMGPQNKYECAYQNLTSSDQFVQRGLTESATKATAQKACQASQYGWHCGFQYSHPLLKNTV